MAAQLEQQAVEVAQEELEEQEEFQVRGWCAMPALGRGAARRH